MSLESVATLFPASPCDGPGCGRVLPAWSGRGAPRRFCSARCKAAAWDADHPRMALLPFDPPSEPIQPLGPTPKDIRRSQGRQARRVLEMLQAGPVTTGRFLEAHIGRFSARIGELRKVGWKIVTAKLTDHQSLYTLTGRER